jgi:CRP-like cAMP-binding protein
VDVADLDDVGVAGHCVLLEHVPAEGPEGTAHSYVVVVGEVLVWQNEDSMGVQVVDQPPGGLFSEGLPQVEAGDLPAEGGECFVDEPLLSGDPYSTCVTHVSHVREIRGRVSRLRQGDQPAER